MATLVFPTGLFGFLSKDIDIERQTLTGGTALSGEQDVVSTDGGGRVFAAFGDGNAVDRSTVLAWRALLTNLEDGVAPIIVPFCDVRHTPYGAMHRVPHSDGTPFSDESLYRGADDPVASTTAPADLRATQIAYTIEAAQPLLGGEWFAIEHPTKGWRAYRIASIDETDGTLRFRPPLREAVPAGTSLEFAAPRCLMRQEPKSASSLTTGRASQPAIRFIEAP